MSESSKSVTLKYYLLLLMAQVMVGINIVGTKYLVASVPILLLLTVRFFIATVILVFLYYITRNKSAEINLTQLNRRDWLFIVAQALAAGVFFNFLMIWGLKYTDANTAGIITSALPAMTALLSWLILREKFTAKMGWCLGFASLGLVIISGGNWGQATENHSLFGDLIIFCSLIPEAMYYVLCRWHQNRLPVFLIAALLNGINLIILMPLLIITGGLTYIQLSLVQWLVMIAVGLASGLFYVFWYIGSAKVEAVKASLSTAIMPVATVIIAWLALGEIITLSQLLGMVLVILSIVFYVIF